MTPKKLLIFLLAGLAYFQIATCETVVHSEEDSFHSFLEQFPQDQYYPSYHIDGLGWMFIDDAKDVVKQELRAGRLWEPHILAAVKKYVKPGYVCLDIGAHFGSISIPMAKLAGPLGKVISFEADWHICRELYWNTKLNYLDNFEIYQYFLADCEGEISWGGYGTTYSPAHCFSTPSKVKMISLDSLNLEKVDFIKMDVECTEDQVLDGAYNTLMRFKPIMIIEIMGGFGVHPNQGGWKAAKPDVRKRIQATISKLNNMGYTVTQIMTDDYLAIPN